jgi:hypothetical protein
MMQNSYNERENRPGCQTCKYTKGYTDLNHWVAFLSLLADRLMLKQKVNIIKILKVLIFLTYIIVC